MKSIKELTKHTLMIKKSEFICTLIPCNDINEVKELIINNSKEDATHNCVAYIVGNSEKADDNGEPSGTAGLPMLNVLKRQELQNVIAIVTRYFGGIKLGAGGLTRAYTNSVAECLKVATIVEKERVALYMISVDYHFNKKVEHLIHSRGYKCTHITYDERVHFLVYLKDESFLNQVQDLTSNTFDFELLHYDYIEKS